MTDISLFATLDLVSSLWNKWAFIVFGVIFFILLPEKEAYAQNSTVSDPSHEIIVVFKNRPTVSLLSALSTSITQNLEIKNGIPASNAMVFNVTSGDVDTAMTEIAKDSNVQSVFPNYPLNLQSVTNDPKADAQWQWHLYKLNIAGTGTSAWNVTTGSASVTVAVIDTGVQSDHPDLAGKISSLVDCSSGTCSAVNSMTDAHPNGHGTHVAGIVAAATNNSLGVAGVGYNTKLMVIKVSSTGAGGAVVTSTDNFFAGIKWAADHGAKVINTSFGVVADSLTPAAITEYNNNVAYAWNRGAVIVASAGNCGGSTNGYDACAIHPNGDPGTVNGYAQNSKLYPAASPNVISVSATTTTNALAGYSEHNDSTNANIGNWIDVAAPGGDGDCSDATKTCIYSTVPTNNYFWDSGTSMSSPAVAGVAALVLAVKPNLTNEQVKTIIENSANHSISAGSNNGLVDALAAVNLAKGTAATSPTPSPTGSSTITPSPTVTGILSPTPTGNITPTAVAPTVTPTTGPTATPTVTPYPTIPPRLPKTPPPNASSFSAPFCPQTVLGVSDNSNFSKPFSISSLFAKPVYAANGITCHVIQGLDGVDSQRNGKFSYGVYDGGNRAQLWYIPTSAKDHQELWKQIGNDCSGTTCVTTVQFPKDDSYYLVCNAFNDATGAKCSGNPFKPLPPGWDSCQGNSEIEVKVPTSPGTDPSPIGSYDADHWGPCAVYGWTCDASSYASSVPVDIYMDGKAPSNYIGSTVATTVHNPADPGPNNACGGTAHDFTFNLPANLHDGREHIYYPLAINIDSQGNTRAQDANGTWLVTWLNKYMSDKMTCLVSVPTVTPGGPTLPPLPTIIPNPTIPNPNSSCARKSLGDANCDGNIDINDFILWQQEFDTMQPASPPNQNANFACIEGNTQTYFVDLTDFELWRRNTASGLIIGASPTPTVTPGGPTLTSIPPTPTVTPGGPTPTPVPPTSVPTSGPPPTSRPCTSNAECGDGRDDPQNWFCDFSYTHQCYHDKGCVGTLRC